jgi:4-amino-4-deoxy-L-arabinose transferase-like glycosyltransferase
MRRPPAKSLALITGLLLVAAFFRMWHLGTTPPGLLHEELVNAQLADSMRHGHISVIYDEVSPGREGLYYGMLAVLTTFIGRGLILWRLPSVWLAMLGLSMTYSLMIRLYNRRVGLLTVGLTAVALWPVWMGRAVLHVTLMPLMIALVAYTFTRAFRASELPEASLWFTVGGIALGVAQYAHVTAWALVLILLLLIAYLGFTHRELLARHWSNVVYALVLAAVLVIPMAVFLSSHAGVREPVPIATQPGLLADIPRRVMVSLAGLALRGDISPNRNVPARPVFDPLTAILFVIGIGVALARWRRASYALALIWLLAGLVPTSLQPHTPNFEYMAVILPIVFTFPALAIDAVWERVRPCLSTYRARLAGVGLITLAALIVVGNAGWTYRDHFVRWPRQGDVRLNYQADIGVLARYLDTSRDPSPISVCVTPVDRSKDPFALPNDELLAYFMHRTQPQMRLFDCRQSLVLAKGGTSQRLVFPRSHYYDNLPGPLLAWLRYSSEEKVPGVRPDVIRRLEVSDILADQVGKFITTAPVAWPPEAGSNELAALPIRFSDSLAFLGYQVRDDTIRRTDWIELTTYWRMDGPPPPELKMFAHMLGTPTVVIAQDDRLGVRMNTLQPRDVFLQHSMIQTRPGTTPGLYALSVGLYVPATEQRLVIYDGETPRASRLFLQRVAVSE